MKDRLLLLCTGDRCHVAVALKGGDHSTNLKAVAAGVFCGRTAAGSTGKYVFFTNLKAVATSVPCGRTAANSTGP